MKTVIIIPGDVFQAAGALARNLRISRSQLYSRAISEYLSRHDPDGVTETLNRLCGEVDQKTDRFIASASRRILESTD